MINVNKSVWYKNNSIDYDDLGFYTVFFCGDDVVFNTIEEAKEFIDKEMI